MTFKIIRKEILQNLLSLRFIFSLLLIVILFASSGFVFVAGHRTQSENYLEKTNKNLSGFREQADQLYKIAFYNHEIWRTPKPLTFCAGGHEKSLPNCFGTDAFGSAWWVKGRHNFLLRQFGDLDWVFIISLPLSFLALFLTYDSICGEREAGTLRLILSRPIPRSKVLLGKYTGAMITITMPLLVGLFVNLIIVYSSGVIELNADDWLKMLVIILSSILYLSIFILLGIFISGRMAYPTNSMVALLLIWVGLVILLPCLGRAVSDVFYKTPSDAVWTRKYSDMVDQWDRDAKAGKFGENATSLDPDPNHPSVNPPAAARYWNAFMVGVMQQREDEHNQRVAQALAGRRYAYLSPLVIYQQATETIAGTGIHRCRNIWEQITRYRHQLKDYVLSQDAEDPDSLHLLFCIDSAVKGWNAISKKSVDFNTVPKFQEKEWTIGESLRLAIWDIGLLALFNLWLFVASWVSFMKYDVR
jgi:ABC-type transport system involved in multi-copper enzyme maturation permease subunit